MQQQVCLFVCAEFQVKSDCEKGRWPSWAEHIDLHGKRGALTMHNLPTAVSNTIGATPFTMQIDMLRPSLAFVLFQNLTLFEPGQMRKGTLAAVS